MLPKLLQSRLREFFPEDYETILSGFSAERVPSFRVNTLKIDEKTCLEKMKSVGFSVRPFSDIPLAYTIPKEEEYRFKGSEFFRTGLVYMQSHSSMLPPLVLDPKANDTILDVCAAPGSKTTQLAAMMENSGRIVALEKSPIRYDILKHNAELQGAENIEAIRMDATKYLNETEETFDDILLDVPCSAEGRIRLDDERTYGFFSMENIVKKTRIQSELLNLAYARLKSGGSLVYATCTIAPEENEGVIHDFLQKHGDAALEKVEFPFAEYRPGLERAGKSEYGAELVKTARILPSENFEGFFVAKIRKQ